MKRFIVPLLLLFVLMVLTVKQATPQRAAALYDHPSQAEQLVIKSAQADKVYLVHTPFELGVRSTTNYRVPYVREANWEGERKAILDKPEGRWHQGQTWRRRF